MQHERRKEIAEFVGIVAILASLLFLGFEIQQSNRIAIASTEIGIRNAYSEFNRSIHSGSNMADLLSRAKDAGVEWTPAEEVKMSMAIADVMNIWQTIETACINGIAQEETCGELDDDIRAFVATFPGLRKQWGFFLENYPSLAHMHMFTILRQALEEGS